MIVNVGKWKEGYEGYISGRIDEVWKELAICL